MQKIFKRQKWFITALICVFVGGTFLVILDALAAENFQQALFAMQWDNPEHRRLLELEGLREWMPPREEGYESLKAALELSNP